MKKEKILVTGGAGFIGSEFVRQVIKKGYKVIVIDKLTYAADLERLKDVRGRFKFYKADICSKKAVEDIFRENRPKIVVNFAAETHVDRSILESSPFIKTNIFGTRNLLDAAAKNNIKKFVHISTDEVYGDIKKGKFQENSPLNPSSPYSAAKASADLLVKAYMRTFNYPAIIIRPSNTYGPWQYPEKFIPVIIFKALKNEKIPVYAKGLNVREWLYVSDCADAILTIMKKGKTGEVYNLGSGIERKNIEVAKTILTILKKPHNLIEFVKDRPGHDYRYSLNSSKLRKQLNWGPETDFIKGIKKTVCWYRENIKWVEKKANYLKSYWNKVYKKK